MSSRRWPTASWCCSAAWRVVRSPFGSVLVAIGENPARARALGYAVDRYKIMVFVISAGLAGLAGGLHAISHGFASLEDVYWTTSGKVVLISRARSLESARPAPRRPQR